MAKTSRCGISLVELLVVICIIAVLIGLLLPPVRKVRESAERSQCMSNLKQIMLALHTYESTHGKYPSGCIGPGNTPEERLSWIVAVLPYMEHESVYRKFDIEKGYAGNTTAAQSQLKVLNCPKEWNSRIYDTVTHYVAMAGVGLEAASRPENADGIGFMGYDRITTEKMITDGTSNTIALGETRSRLGPWARGGASNLRGFDPADVPIFGDTRPFGGHESSFLAALADGSVRSIRSTLEPKHLAAAITIAGGDGPINWE